MADWGIALIGILVGYSLQWITQLINYYIEKVRAKPHMQILGSGFVRSFDEKRKYLLVKLSVTNSSSVDGHFSELRVESGSSTAFAVPYKLLKGPDGKPKHVQMTFGDSVGTYPLAQINFPPGSRDLFSSGIKLKAGESVAGVAVFYIGVRSFTEATVKITHAETGTDFAYDPPLNFET